MQTWTYDAPTGVYKNHEMSSKIRMAAIAECKMLQFVKPEGGYGRKKGESITITRVSNLALPTDASLQEGVKIPEDTLSLSTVAITVKEWGRAVPYTSLSEDLGSIDMQGTVQKALKNQMKLSMDLAASAVMKSSSAKIKADSTGSTQITFNTAGLFTQTATTNLNFYHVEQIRDYMASTLYVPGYEGDDYVCLASTKACRGIKSDSKFEEWHKYTNNESKFTGEIGKIEGVRFIEVTNQNALSGSKGSGGAVGEAIFLGEDAFAMAIVQDPELRLGTPQDFGRSKSVAWYGILNFGVVWDTANPGEARSVHFGSL